MKYDKPQEGSSGQTVSWFGLAAVVLLVIAVAGLGWYVLPRANGISDEAAKECLERDTSPIVVDNQSSVNPVGQETNQPQTDVRMRASNAEIEKICERVLQLDKKIVAVDGRVTEIKDRTGLSNFAFWALLAALFGGGISYMLARRFMGEAKRDFESRLNDAQSRRTSAQRETSYLKAELENLSAKVEKLTQRKNVEPQRYMPQYSEPDVQPADFIRSPVVPVQEAPISWRGRTDFVDILADYAALVASSAAGSDEFDAAIKRFGTPFDVEDRDGDLFAAGYTGGTAIRRVFGIKLTSGEDTILLPTRHFARDFSTAYKEKLDAGDDIARAFSLEIDGTARLTCKAPCRVTLGTDNRLTIDMIGQIAGFIS